MNTAGQAIQSSRENPHSHCLVQLGIMLTSLTKQHTPNFQEAARSPSVGLEAFRACGGLNSSLQMPSPRI